MTHTAIIMAAPNGARKTKQDHPNLPETVEDTVAAALQCYQAGAAMLHAHVRDLNAEHVLDVELYRKLFSHMQLRVPEMLLQMTTEAVGRYQPAEQADCVYQVRPEFISIAVREMAGEDKDLDHARDFYHWCHRHNVHVQHIVFDAKDLGRLLTLQAQRVVPEGKLCCLFVLGRFLENREATPADIDEFLSVNNAENLDWFVCAFGSHEHDCALSAMQRGGHARVGFENNMLLNDGRRAEHNANLVSALRSAAESNGISIASPSQARTILSVEE